MVERQAAGDRPPAPALELSDETGRRVSLADLRGRAVLVSFLSHAA